MFYLKYFSRRTIPSPCLPYIKGNKVKKEIEVIGEHFRNLAGFRNIEKDSEPFASILRKEIKVFELRNYTINPRLVHL